MHASPHPTANVRGYSSYLKGFHRSSPTTIPPCPPLPPYTTDGGGLLDAARFTPRPPRPQPQPSPTCPGSPTARRSPSQWLRRRRLSAGPPQPEALLHASPSLHQAGCGRFFPTPITDDWPRLIHRLNSSRALREQHPELFAAIAGGASKASPTRTRSIAVPTTTAHRSDHHAHP